MVYARGRYNSFGASMVVIKLINSPIKHIKYKFGTKLEPKIWLSDTLQDMKKWLSENQIKTYIDTLEIWFLTEDDRTLFYMAWSQ